MSELTDQPDVTSADGNATDVAPAKSSSLTAVSVPRRTWSNGLPVVKVMLTHHLDHAA